MKFNWLKYLFFLLSIGLTIISLDAGFYIYSSLFGLSSAILISGVFELLRLSCLYTISKFTTIYKALSGLLYIVVAGVCFFAAVLSFNTKVIEKSIERTSAIEAQMNKDIYKIKNAYSKQIEEKIEKIEEHQDVMEQRYARYPSSKYYPQRIEQDKQEIKNLIEERKTFFHTLYSDNISKKEWIQNQKAILGIEDINEVYLEDESPFTKAAKEILNVDEIQLQKLIGFCLVFAIEAGIIMLALLGINIDKIKEAQPTVQPKTKPKSSKKRVKPRKKNKVENLEEPNESIDKDTIKKDLVNEIKEEIKEEIKSVSLEPKKKPEKVQAKQAEINKDSQPISKVQRARMASIEDEAFNGYIDKKPAQRRRLKRVK